jgi:hypothetical protein
MTEDLNKWFGRGAEKIEETTGDRYGKATLLFTKAIEQSSSASGALRKAQAGLILFADESRERASAREALGSFWKTVRGTFVSKGFRSSQAVDEMGSQFDRMMSDVDLLMRELTEKDMSISEMLKNLDAARRILLQLGV